MSKTDEQQARAKLDEAFSGFKPGDRVRHKPTGWIGFIGSLRAEAPAFVPTCTFLYGGASMPVPIAEIERCDAPVASPGPSLPPDPAVLEGNAQMPLLSCAVAIPGMVYAITSGWTSSRRPENVRAEPRSDGGAIVMIADVGGLTMYSTLSGAALGEESIKEEVALICVDMADFAEKERAARASHACPRCSGGLSSTWPREAVCPECGYPGLKAVAEPDPAMVPVVERLRTGERHTYHYRAHLLGEGQLMPVFRRWFAPVYRVRHCRKCGSDSGCMCKRPRTR